MNHSVHIYMLIYVSIYVCRQGPHSDFFDRLELERKFQADYATSLNTYEQKLEEMTATHEATTRGNKPNNPNNP